MIARGSAMCEPRSSVVIEYQMVECGIFGKFVNVYAAPRTVVHANFEYCVNFVIEHPEIS